MKRAVKPSSKAGWWAFGLGVGAAVWGFFVTSLPMLLRPWLESVFGGRVMIPLGLTGLGVAVALAIAAITVGIVALRRGDRAWLVFAGFVPAVIVGGFWILFAVGELLIPH